MNIEHSCRYHPYSHSELSLVIFRYEIGTGSKNKQTNKQISFLKILLCGRQANTSKYTNIESSKSKIEPDKKEKLVYLVTFGVRQRSEYEGETIVSGNIPIILTLTAQIWFNSCRRYGRSGDPICLYLFWGGRKSRSRAAVFLS